MRHNETVTMLNNMIDFTQDVFGNCILDAERSVETLANIINIIFADVTRVSKMSDEALQALQKLQRVLKKNMELEKGESHSDALPGLLQVLKKLSTENIDIQEHIMPIIEALQFQDRMRQQLENAGKMLFVWRTARMLFPTAGMEPEKLSEFCNQLCKLTTMPEERKALREAILGQN